MSNRNAKLGTRGVQEGRPGGTVPAQLRDLLGRIDQNPYLIRWESVEAHEVNFRQTPKRQQFRDLIGKYWAEPPFAEHFELITKDRI